MKIFTIDEANELLPKIVRPLEKIKSLYAQIDMLRDSARAAAEGAKMGGGGTTFGAGYVNSLVEVGRLTTEINDLGVQIKDYSRGLIDFPTMRGDRLVLLCWQIGEEPVLEWWHEIDGGFAGRQRL